MKIKEGFAIREVGGANIVVALGRANADFGGMVQMNETAAFLFHVFQEEMTVEQAAGKLMEEYDVAPELAAKAVEKFVGDMEEMGVMGNG